jgi:acyl transferase domain-containing protein
MQTRVIPIAVPGMGSRSAGGVDSPSMLWEALLGGDDLVTEIPAERGNVEEYQDAAIVARGVDQ